VHSMNALQVRDLEYPLEFYEILERCVEKGGSPLPWKDTCWNDFTCAPYISYIFIVAFFTAPLVKANFHSAREYWSSTDR